ncbi:hypothetical protein MMC08_004253 [Hypocenomyce scalaris]|nr:hypothetical protein [Hypocenomyce scalaris]
MDRQRQAQQDHLTAVESSRLLKQASLDQITFTKPELLHVRGPHRPAAAFTRSNLPRNLSNIRETSESKLGDDGPTRSQCSASPGQGGSNIAEAVLQLDRGHATSTLSLPLASLPERKSSRNVLRRKVSRASGPFNDGPFLPPPPPRGSGQTIPARGQAVPPVRSAVARLEPIPSEMRRIPLRTFVRSVRPTDILDFPKLNHPRVALDLRVSASLFTGGGTVEGSVHITIDSGVSYPRHKSRSALSIGRISVDVLGVESSQGKQWIFRSLANELLDEAHPPPTTMAASTRALFDAFWETVPSSSVLPFRLNLPVYMGPPPYRSKQARIWYILCTTLAVKVSGMQHYVRKSLEIAILSVHDPEKALVSLPNPLTAYDELLFPGGDGHQAIKITAGLHRQTWVSGIPMFVDVHISNTSRKTIKRIELQLEKATVYFDSAGAATNCEATNHLRLPDRTEKEIVHRAVVKKSRHGWEGIRPQSHEAQTRDLDVPGGLVTIDTGRFFGVRYFLNVVITCSFLKHLMVQLPITIIHPNSLDFVPNPLPQVAEAIEHKRGDYLPSRGGSLYHYTQGQAFTAPRKQSLSELGLATLAANEIDDLQRQLESSPRKRVRKARSGDSGHQTKIPEGPQDFKGVCPVSSLMILEEFDGSSLFGYVMVPGERRSKSMLSSAEGQMQRELSLARKRSKSSEYEGWRNIAQKMVERMRSGETYGV